ncbi:hypothetical protein BMW23_0168 [Bodo saltans virus]|uniref:Uncharacterized protein n=1 Tax=Bodo saltans virus TaxID=2024608 RepID=A0A2H4UTP5_9VIRU|nr:hypothetical protein QJ851_gp0164 [Bodo saltans virus]ATZ80227.1 hypothetical protein BMW23_0168 [Bodo saltans virus]
MNKIHFSKKKSMCQKKNSLINGKNFTQKILKNIIAYCIIYPYLYTSNTFNYYSHDVLYFTNIISQYYNFVGSIHSKNSCFIVDPYDENKLYCLDDFCNANNVKIYMETENIGNTYFIPYTTFLLEYLYSPTEKPEITNWSREQLELFIEILEYINKNWHDKGIFESLYLNDFPLRDLEFTIPHIHFHENIEYGEFDFQQNQNQQFQFHEEYLQPQHSTPSYPFQNHQMEQHPSQMEHHFAHLNFQ